MIVSGIAPGTQPEKVPGMCKRSKVSNEIMPGSPNLPVEINAEETEGKVVFL